MLESIPDAREDSSALEARIRYPELQIVQVRDGVWRRERTARDMFLQRRFDILDEVAVLLSRKFESALRL